MAWYGWQKSVCDKRIGVPLELAQPVDLAERNRFGGLHSHCANLGRALAALSVGEQEAINSRLKPLIAAQEAQSASAPTAGSELRLLTREQIEMLSQAATGT